MVIIAIPKIETGSGFSLLIRIQLNTAPDTGIRNFQKFKMETFTPGRFNNEYQMVIAAADKKLSQARANQYFGGNGPRLIPSTGMDTMDNIMPPIINEVELRTTGDIPLDFFAMITFE